MEDPWNWVISYLSRFFHSFTAFSSEFDWHQLKKSKLMKSWTPKHRKFVACYFITLLENCEIYSLIEGRCFFNQFGFKPKSNWRIDDACLRLKQKVTLNWMGNYFLNELFRLFIEYSKASSKNELTLLLDFICEQSLSLTENFLLKAHGHLNQSQFEQLF